MPKPAVVLGNGPSRLQLDLEEIPYDTFGCNGIILEFRPTYLLYGDRGAIRDMGLLAPAHTPVPPEHLLCQFKSAGGNAVYAACHMGYDPIYLIGFDGSEVGHACPKFGLRKSGWVPKAKDTDCLWLLGIMKAASMFPVTTVLLMGDSPSYLDGAFGRAPLKPWEEE